MKTIKKQLKALWTDESGQGATEYILMLVVVVAIAMMFKDNIVKAIQAKIGEVGKNLEDFKPK